nr:hypothetical protein CFP56_72330 [Quercus suber]
MASDLPRLSDIIYAIEPQKEQTYGLLLGSNLGRHFWQPSVKIVSRLHPYDHCLCSATLPTAGLNRRTDSEAQNASQKAYLGLADCSIAQYIADLQGRLITADSRARSIQQHRKIVMPDGKMDILRSVESNVTNYRPYKLSRPNLHELRFFRRDAHDLVACKMHLWPPKQNKSDTSVL